MEQAHDDQLRATEQSALSTPIMIIDADATFAQVLQAYLQLQGHHALVCSAREALRDLRSLQPRVLILDFDGPGVDGYDLLASLGAAVESVRVLVCSHHDEPVGPERASLRALGVTHWLRRPCSLSALAQAIAEAQAAPAP